MIIVLTGHAGAGKDTIADYLVFKYNFTKLSLATKLKEGVATIFGYDYNALCGVTPIDREWREQKDEFWSTVCDKDLTPRKILQMVGTECFRNIFSENFWVACLHNEIKNLQTKGIKNFVISDARFMSEINYLRQIGGVVWEVQRNLPYYYMPVYEYKKQGHWDKPNHSNKTIEDIKKSVHISELEWIYYNNPSFVISNDGTMESLYEKIDLLMR